MGIKSKKLLIENMIQFSNSFYSFFMFVLYKISRHSVSLPIVNDAQNFRYGGVAFS